MESEHEAKQTGEGKRVASLGRKGTLRVLVAVGNTTHIPLTIALVIFAVG